MARPLTVAAAQLGPSSARKAQTVERMVALMEEAGERGVEFLSFPELSLTPYFATKVHESWDEFFEEALPSAANLAPWSRLFLQFSDAAGAPLPNVTNATQTTITNGR